MADHRHLAKLREGVRIWNAWRQANPSVRPNLSGADLTRLDLTGADLTRSNLSNSNLASLSLVNSDFSNAILTGANLAGTVLRQVDFTGADLSRARFDRAEFSATLLIGVCLLGAKGLGKAIYLSTSHIDHRALERSGTLPEILLLGCGFSDSDLQTYRSGLADPGREIFLSCFLSHASRDKRLARTIYNSLTARGVDCFFDEANIQVGNNLVKTILPEIERRDRLIVLITSAVMTRPWVEEEVIRAKQIAISRGNHDMILPVLVGRIPPEVKSWWAKLITDGTLYISLKNRTDPLQIDQIVEKLLEALRKK